MVDFLSLDAYQYSLPSELIAKYPCKPRDHSRLMVINRQNQTLDEMRFDDLREFLDAGDQIILNDTKVIPARIIGKRKGGGKAEVLLLKSGDDQMTWEALVRPASKLSLGSEIFFGDDFSCQVTQELSEGRRSLRFSCLKSFYEQLLRYGQVPLPPYMQRASEENDSENYQTVFAKNPGSAAAPTAGLHFTKGLLDSLKNKGVGIENITLHVGLGTFRPVHSKDIRDHQMHSELVTLSKETVDYINALSKDKRQICIGTTTCRALEGVYQQKQGLQPGNFETDIFMYPGFAFQFTRSLLTNFHLPASTLLMLVCAFGGYELIMEAYHKAIKEKWRFFSYGDSMLIV